MGEVRTYCKPPFRHSLADRTFCGLLFSCECFLTPPALRFCSLCSCCSHLLRQVQLLVCIHQRDRAECHRMPSICWLTGAWFHIEPVVAAAADARGTFPDPSSVKACLSSALEPFSVSMTWHSSLSSEAATATLHFPTRASMSSKSSLSSCLPVSSPPGFQWDLQVLQLAFCARGYSISTAEEAS